MAKPGRGTEKILNLQTARGWIKRETFCVELLSAGADSPWSADISTFFASRCVHSRHCVSSWIRTLLQLSLRLLWSRLSWRVWDSRAVQTWATVLLLGSFLTTRKEVRVNHAAFLHATPAHSATPCFTSWSWRWSGRPVCRANAHTRFQSRCGAEGNRSVPAAAGSSAPAAGQKPSAGPQADNAFLRGSTPRTLNAWFQPFNTKNNRYLYNLTFDLCLIVNQSNALSPEFYMRSHFCYNRGLEAWIQEVKILSNSPVRLLCANLIWSLLHKVSKCHDSSTKCHELQQQ